MYNNKKILSISIAAYNVESCLSIAMDSIVKAKHIDDIEVLIINDGSKDATSKIGETYASKYPDSVKLINKANGGHGSTINSGLENATGLYYRSLDGDDWVDTDNLDKLIEVLKIIDVDIVLCNYVECMENEIIEMHDFDDLSDGKIYEVTDIVKRIPWMCYHSLVFKTSMVKENRLQIQEKCFYCDNEYALYPISYAKNIYYFSLPIYCYRIGIEEQSISASSRMKHIEDSKQISLNVLSFYEMLKNKSNVDEEIIKYFQKNVARICAWHFVSLLYFAPDNLKKVDLKKFDSEICFEDKEIYRGMLMDFKESKSPYYYPMKLLRGSNYNLYNIYGRIRKLIKRVMK